MTPFWTTFRKGFIMALGAIVAASVVVLVIWWSISFHQAAAIMRSQQPNCTQDAAGGWHCVLH